MSGAEWTEDKRDEMRAAERRLASREPMSGEEREAVERALRMLSTYDPYAPVSRWITDPLADAARRYLALTAPGEAAEREEQRRSFAYGNANISNLNVTRAMVDEEASGEPAEGPGGEAK